MARITNTTTASQCRGKRSGCGVRSESLNKRPLLNPLDNIEKAAWAEFIEDFHILRIAESSGNLLLFGRLPGRRFFLFRSAFPQSFPVA